MPRKGMDLTDQTFGMLKVLKEVPSPHKTVRMWLCRCECGKETKVYQHSLRQGKSKSCGCQIAVVAKKHMTTHGGTGSRIHTIWASMKGRCASNHPNYGGRGISVCSEWQDSFESFQSWALANGYTEELTIERENNGGNYEPANCRWATLHEQGLNKRRKCNAASIHKHVTWDNANSKWRAFSKGVCGGRYEHEEDAAKAAQELFD